MLKELLIANIRIGPRHRKEMGEVPHEWWTVGKRCKL